MYQPALPVQTESRAVLYRSISRMNAIVENVVYQHAENVCSLWLQRHYAVNEPHYSFRDIVQLDSRLSANLEGLRVAGDHALPMVEEMINAQDPGAVFMQALLCLEKGDETTLFALINQIDSADNKDPVLLEVESALAWAAPAHLGGPVKSLLTSTDSAPLILGLKTCLAHGRDASPHLEKHYNSSDSSVRSAVYHCAANSGMVRFREKLLSANGEENESEFFERGRALAMLGDEVAAERILSEIALSKSTFNSEATALHMLLKNRNASRRILKKIDSLPDRQRDVVRGFGLLGDPSAMDWLIGKTPCPFLARLAGGAITMITGADLAALDLEAETAVDGFEDDGITDNPADNTVALSEDEDLPWPESELISAWWQNSGKLPNGVLFLAGRERSERQLTHVLFNGMQRQRSVASMLLALIRPEQKLLDTRLPSGKQAQWMT